MAVDIEGDFYLGEGFNSNINAASNDETQIPGIKKIQNMASETDADGSISLIFLKSLTLNYSFLFSLFEPDSSVSTFDHSIDLSYSHEFENADINVGFMLHHSTADFTDFTNKYLQPGLYFDIIHYQNDYAAGFFTIFASLYRSLESDFPYPDGTAFGLELGEYIFPKADKNNLFIGAGERLFILGQYQLQEESDDATLPPPPPGLPKTNVHNQYSETSVRLKGKFYWNKLVLSAELRYKCSYYFDKDKWNLYDRNWNVTESLSKKRIDHTIIVNPLIKYEFTENFSMSAFYSYLKNYSSLGSIDDYTNWNYDRHLAGIAAEYSF